MIRQTVPALLTLAVIGLAIGCGDEPAEGDAVVETADRDPDAIAELERGASSALNLSSFAAAVGGQMPLLEWFARDPHGLRDSGLVDLPSDPDAPTASVVIRGIPGASLAGEKLRLYLAGHACCPDSMVYDSPEGALAMAFDWRHRGGLGGPSRDGGREAMEKEATRELEAEMEARFPPGYFDPPAEAEEDGAP